MLRQLVEQLLYLLLGGLFLAYAYFEDVAVYQSAGEQREHSVVARSPLFHRAPDVAVVEALIHLKAFGMRIEPCSIDIVVQKVSQCRRSEQLMPVAAQLLGSQQSVYEHLLIGNRGFVKIDLPVHQPPRSEVVLY